MEEWPWRIPCALAMNYKYSYDEGEHTVRPPFPPALNDNDLLPVPGLLYLEGATSVGVKPS